MTDRKKWNIDKINNKTNSGSDFFECMNNIYTFDDVLGDV